MLQNAVNGIEELRQVKNTADLMKVNSGRELSYDQYTNLLHSAAVLYDSQFIAKKGKRQVLLHHLNNQSDDYYEDTSNSFDIDTSIDIIQAYKSSFNNSTKPKSASHVKPKVLMSREKWFSLNQSQKEIWDQLDDDAKSIILGLSKPENIIKKYPSKDKFNNKRHINLHKISAF
jgi:hypothetical protein